MTDKKVVIPCSAQVAWGPAAQKLAEEEDKKESERRKREIECKELSNRYSLPARMGHWCEETKLTEEKCKEYEKRHDACLTFLQKQTMVIEHLYVPANIAKFEDVLKYDIAIQIQSDITLPDPQEEPKPQMTISVLITELQIDMLNMLKLDENSLVTVCTEKSRIRRNVLTCVSIGKPPRSPVLYGEDFLIRLLDSGGRELFLSGDVPNVDNFGETKGKVPIVLTSTPDRFAKFHIVDPNPDRMIALQGTAVPTFTRVSISHTVTNLLLALEYDEKISTSFATDQKVDCYTYKDAQRRVTSANYWKFVTQAIDEGAGDAPA